LKHPTSPGIELLKNLNLLLTELPQWISQKGDTDWLRFVPKCQFPSWDMMLLCTNSIKRILITHFVCKVVTSLQQNWCDNLLCHCGDDSRFHIAANLLHGFPSSFWKEYMHWKMKNLMCFLDDIIQTTKWTALINRMFWRCFLTRSGVFLLAMFFH
jgi:hypothetical protein